MYLIAILSVLLIMGFCYLSGGVNLIWYLDPSTLILLLVICIPLLWSAGLLRDFNHAFLYVCGKKKAECLMDLKRAKEAVDLSIKTLMLSGLLFSFIQVTILMRKLTSLSELGPTLFAALLAIIYASALSLILLPLRSQLTLKIMDYLNSED